MDATTSETYASRKTYEIPLLKDDGSNYNAWKFRQTIVLKLRGLFGIVTGTDSPPAELSSADAKDATKVSDQAEAVKKWQKREDDAFAQVTLNMEDGAMADVMEATSALDAWTRVVERWEGKGMQSLSFLYQQLISAKIGEDEDISTGINHLRSIASKMKTLGEPLSDSILAQILMRALPDSYALLNTVITSNPGAVITSDTVCRAALAEEERRKKGAGLTAMFSHIPSNKSKSSNSKSANGNGRKKKDDDPPCLNCGKAGHTMEECWAKGGGSEGTGPHQKRQAAKEANEKTTASTSKSENAKVAVSDNIPRPQETIYSFPVLDEYAKTNLSNSWILDSGATRHMTPNRHWFMAYHPLTKPISIRVGNGSQIIASGVGRISITVQNRQGIESEAVVEDVLHVPDLNSSLLSVRQLNKRGVDVLFNKSAGAVLMGGKDREKELGYAKEVNGLFKLNARIQRTEPTTQVAFVSSIDQSESGDLEAHEIVAYSAHTVARADLTTRHRRLGHINCDYVRDMVGKGAFEGMDIVERVPNEVGDAEVKPKAEPGESDDLEVKSEVGSAKDEPETSERNESPTLEPDAATKPKVEPSEPDDSDVKSEAESAKSEAESETRTRSPTPMPAEPPPVEAPPEPRRSTRETRPPTWYGANVGVDNLSLSLSNPHTVEFTFAADLSSPPLMFAQSMIEELDSIQDPGVYNETKRPRDRNIGGCQSIFTFKYGSDGEIDRYKARFVTDGFSQRKGVDTGQQASGPPKYEVYPSEVSFHLRDDRTSRGQSQYIPTDEQVADVLTKPLGRIKFPFFILRLGMS